MRGKTFLEKIANSVLRECTDVEDAGEHLKRRLPRLVGHLERMNMESVAR